jgi:nitrite reductase (NO-forming)
MTGSQSILSGPTDSYVIDWQVPAEGPFTLVSHALGTQAAKGVVGILSSKKDNARNSVVRSEGPILPIPSQPKRIVDPFGIGTDDVDKVAHFQKGDPVTIQMVGNSFFPKIAEIPAGTEVTWINEDVFDMLEGERTGKHNIAVVETEAHQEPFGKHDEALEHEKNEVYFASPELLHADKYRFKFTKKGAYEYICPTHPYMKGKITVY